MCIYLYMCGGGIVGDTEIGGKSLPSFAALHAHK